MNIIELTLNSNTSPETLDRWSYDVNEHVRLWVAKHPNTTPETLDHLANDKDWVVRRCVACNPNTPIETLKRLTKDKNSVVRYYALSNKNLNNPLKLDTYEFFNWLEEATITDLEEFGNKKL